MPSRILAMASVTTFLLLLVIGCGSEPPAYDSRVNYSPESLAHEFVFQYKDSKTKAGVPERTEQDGPKERQGIAVKSVKASTKEARVRTLDDLIADVIKKAGTIPKLALPEACKQVLEVIAKDPSISEADKKVIAAKLGEVNS